MEEIRNTSLNSWSCLCIHVFFFWDEVVLFTSHVMQDFLAFFLPNVRRNACCRIYVQSGQSFNLIDYNIYHQYFGAHLTNQWTNAVWLGVRGHSWEYRLKDLYANTKLIVNVCVLCILYTCKIYLQIYTYLLPVNDKLRSQLFFPQL